MMKNTQTDHDLTASIQSAAPLDYSIPPSVMPEDFITISYTTKEKVAINSNDESFMSILNFFMAHLNVLFHLYGLTHAFTQPHLSWNTQGSEWTLKIGKMKKENLVKINVN